MSGKLGIYFKTNILDFLMSSCNGKENAVTTKKLANHIRINERDVREYIHILCKEGYPIASSVHRPYGFFIPETREEINECTAQIKSRIRELSEISRALEKAFIDIDSKQVKLG